MVISSTLIVIFGIAVFFFIEQPKFGKIPGGERLEKIKKSVHYKNGAFVNLKPTTVMIKGKSIFSFAKEFLFADNKPAGKIPSIKTDLLKLNPDEDTLVWLGHSSYFIQIDGKKILVDPIMSGSASPVPFTMKAFEGTDPYTADDIPEIDYLFITHDHWDHLDYETVLKLKSKIKMVITGLGTGEHFEYWGFDKNTIIEKDWDEKIMLDSGFTANTVPSRHFSGRAFLRNKSLWTSFVLQTPTAKIFIGCDGGYDANFAEIGKAYGGFDLVILDNGQYNKNWKYIHMMPGETLAAAKDLKASKLLPVHSAKFALAIHAWDEPLKKIKELSKDISISLLTPLIGEQVDLRNNTQKFREWWKDVKQN